MTIIDTRAPPTLQHDCPLLGHVGPCRACEADTARQRAVMAGGVYAQGSSSSSGVTGVPGTLGTEAYGKSRGISFAGRGLTMDGGTNTQRRAERAGRAGLLESLVENGALVGGVGAVNGLGAHAREAQEEPVCDGRLYGKAAAGAPGVIPSSAYAAQVAAHNAGHQDRTFTRAEVLAVLRAHAVFAPGKAVQDLIHTFKRME